MSENTFSNELSEKLCRICGGAIFRVKTDSEITLESGGDAFYSLIGFSREEFAERLDSKCYLLVRPSDLPFLRKVFLRLTRGNSGRRVEGETRIICADGREKWVRLRATLCEENNGFLDCFATDVSDQHRELEEAEVARQTARTASAQTGMSFWLYYPGESRIESETAERTFKLPDTDNNIPQALFEADCIHPDDVETVRQMYEQLNAGRSPVSCIVRWREKNGPAYRWLKIIHTAIHDRRGSTSKIVGSALDITDSVFAEEHYRQQTSITSEYYERSYTVVLLLNLDSGRIEDTIKNIVIPDYVLAGGEYSKLAEYLSAVLDRTHRDRLMPLLERENLLRELNSGSDRVRCDFSLCDKNGDTGYHVARVKLFRRPGDGASMGLMTIKNITDTTLRSKTMEAVLNSEYDYIVRADLKNDTMMLYHLSADCTVQIDPNARVFSQERRRLLDTLPIGDGKITNLTRELCDPRKLAEYLDKNGVLVCTYNVPGKKGKMRKKQERTFYVDKDSGQVGIVSVDITDAYSAEQIKNELLTDALHAAEQANHAKSDFLSSMSHDIRTPMNAIMGLTELALQELDDPEKLKNDLNTIGVSSRHLLNLINDVLDMSRIERGHLDIKSEPMSISATVDRVLSVMKPIARDKGLQLEGKLNFQADTVVYYDHLLLDRVLLNLLQNACRFTPAGGKVSLEVSMLEAVNPKIAEVSFTVADTGVGIAEENLERIFEPFFRSGERNRDRNTGGTGLGLSIVKSILERSGGSISVTSKLGSGTQFKVYLPLPIVAPENMPCTVENEDCVYDFKGKRVLLAEDHPINAMVATRMLENHGAEVIHAANGRQAYEIFRDSGADSFDLIFMDLQMPIADGFEATRMIRSCRHPHASDAVIFAMTANAFTEDVKACYEAGMNGHISKPINFSEIEKKLGEFFTARQ